MIKLAGRTDTQDFFEKSDMFDGGRLVHNPFLVFEERGEDIEIALVYSSYKLLDYPDDTKVMGQWPGKWRSDWFRFTVGEYKDFQVFQFNPLKHATAAQKYVGPRGGFKTLSYQYNDVNGRKGGYSTGDRDEARRIEATLKDKGIEITERLY